MGYELPPLPYAYDALAPHISKETLEFHHDKHHAAYVTKYNDMVKSAGMDDKSIEEVIKATYNDSSKSGLFNNGAQAWNHTFFWNSMKPGGGGAPTGAIADKINSDLGGYEKFKEEFSNAAATQFGSGWAWLVLDNGTLKIINSPNAVNPIALGHTPLLTLDVWEHAYYLDYQNKRPAFIDAFINNLINWDFVNENMKG
jgi:Fe-Mn family superoxide dismutase